MFRTSYRAAAGTALAALMFDLASVSLPSPSYAAEQQSDEQALELTLDRVERVLYGEPSSGGLLLRLSRAERDVYGIELPGSLTERQQALLALVQEGVASQPSMLFKMGVAEWLTLRRANSAKPFADRISELEVTLEGEQKVGALSARLESLLTKLLPSGIASTPVQIPAATVFKGKTTHAISVRNVAVGDVIELEIDEDCIIGGTIAVVKGNRLFAEVTKVKPPRSFGRPSEINLDFKYIETIGEKTVPVTVGSESEKAMEMDSGTLGAAGASLAGAIAFGPLGLVGGLLVRGNDKQIPEGTYVYVETKELANVDGYVAPNLLNTLQQGADDASAPQQIGDAYQDGAAQTNDAVVY